MIIFNNKKEYPYFCTLSKFAVRNYYNDTNYYHTIHHVYDMLMMCRKDEEYIKSIVDIDSFITAILFHDAVYKTANKDNELSSAKFFERVYNVCVKANEIEENDNKKQLIYNLILSTKFGSNLITEAEKLLHDYDYFGLSNINTMKMADKQIVNEAMRDGYSFIQVLNGRIEFYQYLLENGNIFVTDKYKHLNEITINNIKENITQ